MYFATLKREILININNKGTWLASVWFFCCVVFIFTTAIQQLITVSTVNYHIVWASSVFAMLLAADSFWRDDYDNGIIEFVASYPQKFNHYITAKFFANWLVVCLPLLIMSLLFIAATSSNNDLLFLATVTFLIASLACSYCSIFAGSITCCLPKSGMLLVVLVFPLIIPAIVLAFTIVQWANIGISYNAPFALLLAYSICMMFGLPVVTKYILRISL